MDHYHEDSNPILRSTNIIDALTEQHGSFKSDAGDPEIVEVPYESRPYEKPATRVITTIENGVLVRKVIPITGTPTIITNTAHPTTPIEGTPPPPPRKSHLVEVAEGGVEKTEKKEETEKTDEAPRFDIDTRIISGLYQCGGNDCYMNSVVQALCGTDLLATYFVSKRFNKHVKDNIIKNMYVDAEQKFKKKQEAKKLADPEHVDEEFEFSVSMKSVRKRKKNTISYAFYQLLNYMWSENCKIKPSRFKKLTNERIIALRGDNQEDAHEFLTFLFDELEQELRIRCSLSEFDIVTPDIEVFSKEFVELNNAIKNEKDKDEKTKMLSTKHDFKNQNFDSYVIYEYVNAWREYYKKFGGNYSIISDIFDFPYMTISECLNCNDKTIRFTPEKCMTLPVPKSDKQIELMDLIKNECSSVEDLTGSNGLDCDYCGTRQDKRKQAGFWSFPERLIIHLKLFEMKLITFPHGQHPVINKLNTKVTCPFEIDLNELKSEYNKSDINYTYELYAIVRHYGSYRGGHYVSYVKNIINDQWFQFDDSRVRPATEDRITDETPFILFYKRKNIFDSDLFETSSSDSSNEDSNSDDSSDTDIIDGNVPNIQDDVEDKETPVEGGDDNTTGVAKDDGYLSL